MLLENSVRQCSAHARLRSAFFMLAVLLAFFFVPAASRYVYAFQQEREQLNRLAQLHDAMQAFREGKTLIAEEQWDKAALKFSEAIARYPNGDPADAALYWLAFSLREQGKFEEAKKALNRLFEEFPESNWINDATTMRIEIASQLGEKDVVIRIVRKDPKASDEVQIAAMQGLFKTDTERALEIVDRTLKADSQASARLKEAAITLLGMQGGKQPTTRLIEVARSKTDAKLRRKAIYWLGRSNDPAALQLLRELAVNTKDKETSEAALAAVSMRKNREAWLVVKDGGHTLEFSKDRIVRIDGAGKLVFKDNGRVVEIPRDHTVKVNGEAVYEKRIVHEGEDVRVVDENNQTIWNISSVPDEQATPFDNTTFNGDFTFLLDTPEAYLLKPTSDGMRMRSIPPAVKFGIKTDSLDDALAAQLGLKHGAAMLVTEVSEGVLTGPGGLLKFDVITHADGKAGEGEMWPVIYKKSQDTESRKLTLRIIRNRQAFEVTYTISQSASGQSWQAEMRAANSPPIASSSNSNDPAANADASDDRQPSYQISVGSEPKLLLLNANGELFIRSRKGVFDAMINGAPVAASRLIRQGGIMRVSGANGDTLFVVGVLPNGGLIYSPALDPFTLRGRLGLTTDGIGNALAAQLGLKPQQALLVADVTEGMPAARSGLKSSDIIIGFDGQEVSGAVTLDQIMFMKKRGDTLKLRVLRGGQQREVVIEINDEPRWQDFRELEKRYLEVNRKLESLGSQLRGFK